MKFIYRLKSSWTTLKFVRVGLGSLILYSSIESGEVLGIILGGFFSAFALFADGVCCGSGSCYTHAVKKNDSVPTENIEYEELGIK